MAITSSGVVAHQASSTLQRVQPQLRNAQPWTDPAAAARAKDLAATIRLQNHEPYNFGNAFDDYEALAEN